MQKCNVQPPNCLERSSSIAPHKQCSCCPIVSPLSFCGTHGTQILTLCPNHIRFWATIRCRIWQVWRRAQSRCETLSPFVFYEKEFLLHMGHILTLVIDFWKYQAIFLCLSLHWKQSYHISVCAHQISIYCVVSLLCIFIWIN